MDFSKSIESNPGSVVNKNEITCLFPNIPYERLKEETIRTLKTSSGDTKAAEPIILSVNAENKKSENKFLVSIPETIDQNKCMKHDLIHI